MKHEKKTFGTILGDNEHKVTFPPKELNLWTQFYDHPLDGICYVDGIPHWILRQDVLVEYYYVEETWNELKEMESSIVEVHRIYYVTDIEDRIHELMDEEKRQSSLNKIREDIILKNIVGIYYEKLT